MAAAIIIYIFFRAGQLTLTGGGAPENKIDDLNPYVLSFLAIASGLLSEKAYNRIVVGARNMLGGDGRPENGEAGSTPAEARPADASPADASPADASPADASRADTSRADTSPPPSAHTDRAPVR